MVINSVSNCVKSGLNRYKCSTALQKPGKIVINSVLIFIKSELYRNKCSTEM